MGPSIAVLLIALAITKAEDHPCSTGLGPNYKQWKSNQTHELHITIQDSENCQNPPCSTDNSIVEASVDIQSGDILLVYMNENRRQPRSIANSAETTSQTPAAITSALPTPRKVDNVIPKRKSIRFSPKSPLSWLGVSTATTSLFSSTSVGTLGTAVPAGTPTTSTTTANAAARTSARPKTTATSATPLVTTTAYNAPPQATVAPLQVFSVSRPGPVDCDPSEGVQLDVAPIAFDGNSLLTFYEKDLTEGVNMLLIVSGSWHGHCAKIKITVKSENCGEGENCSGKGICYTNASMEDYECQCCPSYIGPHCEERDACFQSPCKNNGICVDISQGHEGSTFQCLCPYGFTGKVCEDTSDPCESGPCQHGGTCRPSNETAHQFKCVCPPGFTGQQCQHTLDPCASSPCRHGICVEQHDGYRCFCQPGFTGSQCQEEYNECESSPCLNGGTCTDHIDSFSCSCDRGYTGKRCHIKRDLCDPNPCSHHHYCIDKGNTYSCECPKGFTGVNCLIPTRAACSANPCRNGGTCWSSVDSFYCACRPGYTGKICNEEVIIEVIPSASDTIEVDGPDGNMDLSIPLDMNRAPVAIHLDHLHNVYVAAGTLACAVLIVVFTVIICHCRMHETYKYCCCRSSPLLPINIPRFDSVMKKTGTDRDKEPLAQTRPFPALDSSDVYYALDFSDSQSSPLIQ